MDGSISFNANSLQTFNRTTRVGIITDHIDNESSPDKDIPVFGLAHSNQSTIPNENTPSKQITVTGTIVSDTANNLSTLLNTFRGYFNGKNKNLDIGYGGSTRRYTATAKPPTITRSEDKKYAKFSIVFICTIPFGTDTTSTLALDGSTGHAGNARTAATYSDTYTFLGSAPFQLPIVTVTLTAVSATGAQQMFFGNSETGQSVTITRSGWTAGDVVIFDCVAKQVTVNGVPIDFTGAFPEFSPVSHTMIYGDSFTSRTMNENIAYAVRNL